MNGPGKVNHPTPRNLDECVEFLKHRIPADELEDFKNLPERRAIGIAHHKLGRHLRNNWGLWTGSSLKEWFVEQGVWHADDMSGIIIKSLHRSLNGTPVDLERQVEFYREYWAKMKDGETAAGLRIKMKDGEIESIEEEQP